MVPNSEVLWAEGYSLEGASLFIWGKKYQPLVDRGSGREKTDR